MTLQHWNVRMWQGEAIEGSSNEQLRLWTEVEEQVYDAEIVDETVLFFKHLIVFARVFRCSGHRVALIDGGAAYGAVEFEQ